MATESSQLRKQYGKSKTPIQATRVFVKDMPHFQSSDGKSWVLINDSEGTRISANTYNGNAGKNFVPQVHPIPVDEKDFEKLVKGYIEVKVTECPIAEAVKGKSKKATTNA